MIDLFNKTDDLIKYEKIISLVCFLIYGVKRGSGHDGRMSFGPILHVRVQKWYFDEMT